MPFSATIFLKRGGGIRAAYRLHEVPFLLTPNNGCFYTKAALCELSTLQLIKLGLIVKKKSDLYLKQVPKPLSGINHF
jgi:hypothetical protein